MSQFCCAYKDRAILEDSRVLRNMLELEEFYMPSPNLYDEIQDEIRVHMRKIVTEWMLDVCLDSRCHVDVFLLATNIMDRFLATIRLQKKQFQLLGAASIFLASKMIEPQPISALTLVRNTADTYDREELLVSNLPNFRIPICRFLFKRSFYSFFAHISKICVGKSSLRQKKLFIC